MAKLSTVTFQGKSGSKYDFDVWPMDQTFKDVGAVYAVTRRYQDGNTDSHDIIYVGETGDLSTRFDNHHKADCFTEHKANCICTHLDSKESSRLAKEEDLVKKHNPPCND
jgi:hypothetical protein